MPWPWRSCQERSKSQVHSGWLPARKCQSMPGNSSVRLQVRRSDARWSRTAMQGLRQTSRQVRHPTPIGPGGCWPLRESEIGYSHMGLEQYPRHAGKPLFGPEMLHFVVSVLWIRAVSPSVVEISRRHVQTFSGWSSAWLIRDVLLIPWSASLNRSTRRSVPCQTAPSADIHSPCWR